MCSPFETVPLAEFIAGKLTITTPTEVDNGAGIPLFFSTALERVICVQKIFLLCLSEAGKYLSM